MAQEMYDLIPCTYFPHEVTSFTGQSRTRQKLECYDIPIKYVD